MRKILITTVAAAAAILAVAGCSAAGDSMPSQQASSSPAAQSTTAPPSKPTPKPTPRFVKPRRSDYSIQLKVKSKHCFGSAGCNVEVEPKLTHYTDRGPVNPDITYEITYRITGSDDGPMIDTMELTAGSYTSSEGFISTASANVIPKSIIMSVQEQ